MLSDCPCLLHGLRLHSREVALDDLLGRGRPARPPELKLNIPPLVVLHELLS